MSLSILAPLVGGLLALTTAPANDAPTAMTIHRGVMVTVSRGLTVSISQAARGLMAMPIAAPIAVSSIDSPSTCRRMKQFPAPLALRIAISRVC
ncbi:MAG: hypothetical protein ABIG68_14240 [Acidobacteriota bacterium]